MLPLKIVEDIEMDGGASNGLQGAINTQEVESMTYRDAAPTTPFRLYAQVGEFNDR
jgi:hypothetical protein